jgi:hypothetical protein
MPTLHHGVKRLAIAAALVGVGCSTPDSSALYRPSEVDAIRPDEPSPAVTPDDPPGEVDTGAAGAAGSAGSGRPPIVVSPVSSVTDAGLSSTPPPTPSEPEDAGISSVPEAPDASGPQPPIDPAEPAEPAEPDCSGTLVDGVCWYLGELDRACVDVCATRGGVDPASTASIGTPEQGGSLESCAAILAALGGPAASLQEGFREDDLGFGCHVFVDAAGATSAWWLTAPAFAPTVADPNASIVCGCAR